ncbi:MAG: hypothetical protein HN842_10950 [Gammaproteobacteria bacterium]|jgi:hypothetical protein|nr:hypothetical protein [Gammaproteobacteria bacterium]MBT7308726.1 hypothetical protein [Gammaproteobacteria bacterium]
MSDQGGTHFLTPVEEPCYSEYTCRTVKGAEYAALLQLLVTISKPVQILPNSEQGATRHYHITQVLRFDPEQKRLLLKPAGDHYFNESVLKHGVTLLADLDEGMLQLKMERVEITVVGVVGYLPETYLLVQHRQAHRTKTHGELRFASLNLRGEGVKKIIVEDLSDLGLGLKLIGTSLQLPPKGDLLEDGVLTLPMFGDISVQVKVMGGHRYQGTDGREGMLLGVTFVRLSSGTRALLQRYIFRRDLEDRGRIEELENLEHSQNVSSNPVIIDRM